MMKRHQVQLLSSSNIVAAQQQNASSSPIVLSPLDHFMGYSSYQKRCLFFNSPHVSEGVSVVSILKDSLAKSLVHFYPFAGRISLSDNEVMLLLHCNNAGVTFLEAETDASLSDLGEFLPSEFCDDLCQMEVSPEWPWRIEYPLFTVQVTHFACGGLSVGVYFSHQICDGPSFWYFMNSWSEIARTGSLQLEPVTTFKIPIRDMPPEERLKHQEKLSFSLIERQTILSFVRATGWKGKNELAIQRMKFSRQDLESLKSMASPGRTSFEVLTGYLWKRLAKSWGTPGDEKTGLYVLVNVRQRLKNLSKGYIGNGVLPTGAVATVEELEQRSFGHAADLVHEAIRLYTEDTVEGVISYTYEHAGNERYIPMIEINPGNKVLIVSSPRHPIYETDFGWGRPAGNTFGANDLGHGKVFLYPSAQGNGAVDVTVSLNRNSMDIFVENKEFLS